MIEVEGETLRQNGRRRDKHLEQVHVLNSGALIPFVRDLPPHLDQRAIDEVMLGLLERLPPRTVITTIQVGEGVAVAPPEEALFFLQRWSKHGHSRLYVKADDGSELGFLNLVTGDVSVDDEWRTVLARLLPHFIMEPVAAVSQEELSKEATGVFRRLLDAVLGRERQRSSKAILAAVRWRNYGKDRLYLHRVEATGSRVEVGWIDLKDGSTRSAIPGGTEILSYCADRFRMVFGD